MRAPNNNNYILDQQSCATQTEPLNGNHSVITASVFTQTDAKSTPPTPTTAKATAIPKKVNAATNKEETHLLTTVRGMRVDLAIKEKAMQRLTRELDECKKAMKKMQKERDGQWQHKHIHFDRILIQITHCSRSSWNETNSERQKTVRSVNVFRIVDRRFVSTAGISQQNQIAGVWLQVVAREKTPRRKLIIPRHFFYRNIIGYTFSVRHFS